MPGQFEVVDAPPQKKGRFEVVDLPKEPSLMQQINQSLEPEEGEGPVMRSFKGSWRALAQIPQGVAGIATAAATPPKTTSEKVASIAGPGGLLAKRLIVDPAMGSFRAAKQSWDEGRPIRAGVHALAGAVPMVGPYVDSLISRGEQGDIAGALTEAGTGIATGKFISGTAPRVSKLFDVEPKVVLNQAIMRGRRYKTTQAAQSIEKAIPSLRKAENSMGNPIINGIQDEAINNFLDVLGTAKRDLWSQYSEKLGQTGKPYAVMTPKRKALPPGPIELGPTNPGEVPQAIVSKSPQYGNMRSEPFEQWRAGSVENKLEQAKNAQLIDVIRKREAGSTKANVKAVQNPPSWQDAYDIKFENAIDGNAIADAGSKSINSLTRQTKKAAANQIEKENDTFRRPYSIPEAEELLQNINRELMTFYRKNKIDRRGAEGNPTVAAKAARADALRQSLYAKLDELTGPGAKEIKAQYGALMNLERESISRAAQVAGQAPMDLPQQLGTMYGIGRMLTHPIEGAGNILLARKLKEMNSTNYLIQKAFNNMNKKGTGKLRAVTDTAPKSLPLMQSVSDWKNNQY